MVQAHRDRLRRNLMATLMLSQGVPMVLHGDEIGRTQQGNNNGYAQDNEISWVDWSEPDRAFLAFCRRLIELRRRHPALQRHRFLTGQPVAEGELPDVAWFRPDGTTMGWDDWGPEARQVAMWLNGDLAETGPRGEAITDDTLLVCINAADAPSSQVLPPEEFAPAWALVLDTASAADPPATRYPAGGTVQLGPRTILFLERRLAPAPAGG